jgi:hypothetical protein
MYVYVDIITHSDLKRRSYIIIYNIYKMICMHIDIITHSERYGIQ